jgi:hypothetical protein
MNVISPVILLFLFAVARVSAQDALPQAADLSGPAPRAEVVEKKWYMEVNNPAFEKSPFGAVEEVRQTTRNQRAIRRQNEIRARRGLPPLRTPARAPQPETENGKSPNIYTYKVKIKNTGEKAIQTLVWDYVFFEAGTEKEVGRLQFLNKTKISPGKTKELSVSSLYPPAETISAAAAGRKTRDQYSEQVIIQSIEYSDGSVWQAAQN